MVMSFGVAAASPTVPDDVSVYMIEAETGIVLFEHNADQIRPPASMIKLLMMLLVAEGLEQGRWTLDDQITASRHAQRMGGTQVYLSEGEVQPLSNLMLAVAVASANDAAMAVAEGLWGSEEAYLDAVNARAQELGMSNSTFRSVHGLPPDRGDLPDETTAHDMALLGRECVRHAQILAWTRTGRIQFRPKDAPHLSTNKLLQMMAECDGLKTGYIRAAGFCVTATAERNGVRVITVVMGHPDSRRRFQLAQKLLDQGLGQVRKGLVLVRETEPAREIPIENGKAETVDAEVTGDISITTLADDWDRVTLEWELPERLTAPVKAGSEVGLVRAVLDGTVLGESPVVLSDGVEASTWIWKTEKLIRGILGQD
jgi:D-alanyl-D-alanine carboxypeptidase (penicillin-binding protein 5/6)